MPKLIVDGVGEFDVPADKRLTNALIDIAGVDQLHACGGFAKCTSCKVQFINGEPTEMTVAEKAVLSAKGLDAGPGVRLSCQMLCGHDMTVKVISRFEGSGRKDSGKRPAEIIEPPPEWTTK